MSVARIASRYAKSLIDLAQEQNKLDRILEDVQSFQKVTSERDFYLLLKSPIVNEGKKRQIFEALFKGKYDDLTLAFLDILLRKKREGYLPEISKEFLTQYKIIKHISTVKITTAAPLSEKAVESIRQKLLASDATDDNVEIETAVDENLIGGFVLEFDDKMYDSSVSHKLKQLSKEFEDNLYISQIIAR